MELAEYLKPLSSQERTSLAAKCGTTVGYLNLVRFDAKRQPGEKLCVNLERETQGALTRPDLRPTDWWECWPELIAIYPHRLPPEHPAYRAQEAA